jgi:hypothetical protein
VRSSVGRRLYELSVTELRALANAGRVGSPKSTKDPASRQTAPAKTVTNAAVTSATLSTEQGCRGCSSPTQGRQLSSQVGPVQFENACTQACATARENCITLFCSGIEDPVDYTACFLDCIIDETICRSHCFGSGGGFFDFCDLNPGSDKCKLKLFTIHDLA